MTVDTMRGILSQAAGPANCADSELFLQILFDCKFSFSTYCRFAVVVMNDLMILFL
jgi:hypothetical protein